ncbi:MAG TPA: alkaline phosphatase D family protein [Opitutaceae bacterium]|nr:alkaline phosphatase D family protein [Opitutaceae bacterium]
MNRAGCLLFLAGAVVGARAAVFQADGIKIAEVTPRTAVVWVRLTAHPDRNLHGTPFVEVDNHRGIHGEIDPLSQIPPGRKLEDMEDAVPGAPGRVRVSWSPVGRPGSEAATDWIWVDSLRDYTARVQLSNLAAGTSYRLRVESRDTADVDGQSVEGSFATPPAADTVAPARFIIVTCHDDWRRDNPTNGFDTYAAATAWHPDFFIHTGDYVYLDKRYPFGMTVPLARFKWNRTSSFPYVRDFYRNVASYFQKDDHDVLCNDSWPGERYGDLTWNEGLAIEREQLPEPQRPYRTLRWGHDVELWLLEGREYRSPDDAPDGPAKTWFGAEQKKWFFDTVAASKATFRIIVSPDAIVGPNVAEKGGKPPADCLADPGRHYEGQEIRRFLGAQRNVVVVAGDRHWQYHSVDPETGLNEFGCGPICEGMAEGFKRKVHRTPMHRFLRVDGGFLSGEVTRTDGMPTLVFQYHDVHGKVLYTARFLASH